MIQNTFYFTCNITQINKNLPLYLRISATNHFTHKSLLFISYDLLQLIMSFRLQAYFMLLLLNLCMGNILSFSLRCDYLPKRLMITRHRKILARMRTTRSQTMMKLILSWKLNSWKCGEKFATTKIFVLPTHTYKYLRWVSPSITIIVMRSIFYMPY